MENINARYQVLGSRVICKKKSHVILMEIVFFRHCDLDLGHNNIILYGSPDLTRDYSYLYSYIFGVSSLGARMHGISAQCY